jgi:hypothetical protein
MLSRPGHLVRLLRLPIVLLAASSPMAWTGVAAAAPMAAAAASLYSGGPILTMATWPTTWPPGAAPTSAHRRWAAPAASLTSRPRCAPTWLTTTPDPAGGHIQRDAATG